MKKILAISAFLTLAACSDVHQIQEEQSELLMIGMANPASVYCEQQGGKSEVKRDAQGNEYGICLLPNGEQVDEWDFYRQQQAMDKQTNQSNSDVLIVYYDVAKRDKVLTAIHQQSAEIVYDYKNFAAFAIKTPQPDKTKQVLQQVEGILQVQFDEKQQLHKN
ncbi:putative hemolysin [Volucribacter amazonae]|uniref:putative hemolysin n=1 Tax=Volucribacter amazonae TaxID=256731 RepID=UPI0024411900|nr:DUF333 domain-containing protein [Volucribacter amazonae]